MLNSQFEIEVSEIFIEQWKGHIENLHMYACVGIHGVFN